MKINAKVVERAVTSKVNKERRPGKAGEE